MAITFEGQVAVVTGAGNGLGRAHALEMARRGASVVVNDLEPHAADAVVSEIVAAGGSAAANYSSVSTPAGGDEIYATALERFGRVDVLVNNAGTLRDRSFAKLSNDELDLVLDTQLKGAFYVTQPVFRQMQAQNYGRLIFTSSNVGLFGNFGQANYAAAKMGLVGLANVLAIEGAKRNITSNVIAPIAATRQTASMFEDLAASYSPDEVAALVCYLASTECTSTHEIFSVGGGRLARVRIAVTEGWKPGGIPSVEDVAAAMPEILSATDWVTPLSGAEEVAMTPAASAAATP
ncbi:SDR family NAD(P)-dependent oxidoreductase [Streptomyces sp. NPDC090088]|uniref:SDR family NAD(P)-dependent oxidoreductase n=1 Tax=Streptomyces sp. NPDC090088 TaxID=3365944 RepID=UPI0037FC0DAC